MSLTLNINQDFKNLLPPLKADAFSKLERDICIKGCLDAIRTWNGTIVDGHHRYAICKANDIEFKVIALEFEDKDEAVIWMIDHQNGRRELEPFQRVEMQMQKEDLIQRRKNNQHTIHIQKDENGAVARATEADKPSRQLASQAGVSKDTYFRAKYIAQNAPEEVKEKLRKGEETIKRAYKNLKKEERIQEVLSSLNSIESKEVKATQGVYDVITIDPPWDIEGPFGLSNSAGYLPLPYPTMSLEEIQALKVPCAEDCHVFLWTTQKFLPKAFEVLEAWNLEYVCTFTWAKNGGPQPLGLPQYNTEFFLYARKGKPKFIDTKELGTLLEAKRGKHSEKPEAFYDLIRRVTAGRRLDMFNRRAIDGFETWGNEAQSNISA